MKEKKSGCREKRGQGRRNRALYSVFHGIVRVIWNTLNNMLVRFLSLALGRREKFALRSEAFWLGKGEMKCDRVPD